MSKINTVLFSHATVAVLLGAAVAACGGSTTATTANAPQPNASAHTGSAAANAPTPTPDGHAMAKPDREETTSYLVAFVVMRQGQTPDARAPYAARLDEVAKEHGIEHVHAYRIAKPFGGELIDAAEVHLWRLPNNPEAFDQMLQDPDYVALGPERERLHDPERIAVFVADANLDGPQLTSPYVLVDLVFLNDGFTLKDRAAYGRSLAPIAKRHKLGVARSFGNLRHRRGPGAGAVQLNLWEIDNPEQMGAVMQDPEYQAMVPKRNEIHDMTRLTMLLAQPLDTVTSSGPNAKQ